MIFVMEKKHLKRLEEKFRTELKSKRVICLHIPDDYKFMDDELIDILESRVEEYLVQD